MCPDAEALAAFKHNIRDEWLARHLDQEKPNSMVALTTLMTRFCTGEDSWLARNNNTSRNPGTSMPKILTADHVATDTSAATTATTPKTRQSMPDSVALNLVSGKSRSKEAIRARPVWTAYLIVRAKFTAPLINQPTTPTGNAGCLNRLAS